MTEIAWDLETDIAVLGCGAAGSAAPIDGHNRGADVAILEKMFAFLR